MRADATCHVPTIQLDPTGVRLDPAGEGLEGTVCAGDLLIFSGTVVSNLNGAGTIQVDRDLTIQAGARLMVNATPTFALINVGRNLDLQTGARIDLTGRSGVVEPPGTGGSGINGSGAVKDCAGPGGGHGGQGGIVSDTDIPGAVYGSAQLAELPGSTGGSGVKGGVAGLPGGAGGGSIRILVGGQTLLNGNIIADGAGGATSPDLVTQGSSSGGGSGGSIYLRTQDLHTDNTGVRLSANGGRGGAGQFPYGCTAGAGGGGGRITVYYSGINDGGGVSPISQAASLSCSGAEASTASSSGWGKRADGKDRGADGSCFLTAASGVAPIVTSVSTPTLGQGVSYQTVRVFGSGFIEFATAEIGGAGPGETAGLITVHSSQRISSSEVQAVISVGYDPNPLAGPVVYDVSVRNPNLTSATPQPLITVTPPPVILAMEDEAGQPVTTLPRGFTGTVKVTGANITSGATLVFDTAYVQISGALTVDVGNQFLSTRITVAQDAPSGAVLYRIVNSDGGTSEVAGSFDVLSDPVIALVSPDSLFVGQRLVDLTISGSGFIAASQVQVEGLGMTVSATRFDNFNQLTATVTVDIDADLVNPVRNLRVNNGDGGISSPFAFTLLLPPPDTNAATLVYGEVAASEIPAVIEPVTWTDLVGVAVNGTVLSKTAIDGWGNGGAASQQSIPGDGAFEFTALETNTGRFMGLSSINADAGFTTIDYALALNNLGEVRVYEQGVNIGTFGTYAAGDAFRVQRLGSEISYLQNGVPLYTSTVPSSGPLLVDVALNQTGSTVADGVVFISPRMINEANVGTFDRFWNGFGWRQPGQNVTISADVLRWVVLRAGFSGDDTLVAAVDAARNLGFQERVGGVWQAPVAAGAVPEILSGMGDQRSVDAVRIQDVAGERFLAVYGDAAGGALSYRVFGTTPTVPAQVPATGVCAGADLPVWVRLAGSSQGDEAVLAYAKANNALCAIRWTGSAFDPASEIVLAGASGLSSVEGAAFDVTYWSRGATEQAMVAWGVSGSGMPGVAVWNGSWTTGQALIVSTSATDPITHLRLSASSLSDRVALANSNASGELFSQFWNGTGWGGTTAEVNFPVLLAPQSTPTDSGRAFDVVWTANTETAYLVYGRQGDTTPLYRSWNPTAGWSAEVTMGGASGFAPGWVQLHRDGSSGQLLLGVLDVGGSISGYNWDGVGWSDAFVLSTPGGASLPAAGERFMAAYRYVNAIPPLVVGQLSYQGGPARLGIGATSQALDVFGSGFQNPVGVGFNYGGIVVEDVQYISSEHLRVTVSVGATAPTGGHPITLTNADGNTFQLDNALQVDPPVNVLGVELVTVPAACGSVPCAFQGDVGIEVRVTGTGIQPGAAVRFDIPGVTFNGPTSATPGTGPGETVLAGLLDIAGNARPGPGSVVVINPDSSSGVASGAFEILPFLNVTGVSPSALGAGAQGVNLIVTGNNLQPGLLIDLGLGVFTQSVTWENPTQVRVMVNILPNATPGPRIVSAFNPDGGQVEVPAAGNTTPVLFSVSAPPVVTRVSPTDVDQGQTIRVRVEGSGLTPLSTGVGAISYSGSGVSVTNVVASPTLLEFDVSAAVDAGFLTPSTLTIVRADEGRAVVPKALTVHTAPLILTHSPQQITAQAEGVLVTLDGSGFHPDAAVLADPGLTVAGWTVVDSNRIKVFLDAGAATGTYGLTVINPDGRVSNAVLMTVQSPVACDVSGTTLTLTSSSGSLSCASVSVSAGGTLKLVGDITLKVLGDVTVSDGQILVDSDLAYGRISVGGNLTVGALGQITALGTGYPGGGFAGAGLGLGGGPASTASNTDGIVAKGGGYGGAGGMGVDGGGFGRVYDMSGLCGAACFGGVPVVPGSGGGAAYAGTSLGIPRWHPGGTGGGAVVLDVAGIATIDGSVNANGADGWVDAIDSTGALRNWIDGKTAGGGSGGSVLLQVTDLVGAGTVGARGGDSSPVNAPEGVTANGTGGGGGRVAVYYRNSNGFTGTIDCSGGTSRNPDPTFQGDPGTCIAAPLIDVTGVTPNRLGANTSTPITVTGSALAATDVIRFQAPELSTSATVPSGQNLTTTLTIAAGAPTGGYDLFVQRQDGTGGILFDGISVIVPPSLDALTPNWLSPGQSATVVASGHLLRPGGAQVDFLRGGVIPQCGGVACVAATVNEAASDVGQLELNVTVSGTAEVGAYNVRLTHANGVQVTLPGGFAVTDGSTPVLSRVEPAFIGDGVSDFKVRVYGFDFGVPPTVDQVTSATGVTFAPDLSGCPNVVSACAPTPDEPGYVDMLVSVSGAAIGVPLDVTVWRGAISNTMPGAITINPIPVLSGFTPAGGVDNFVLTVTGSGFADGAAISLGEALALVGETSGTATTLTTTIGVDALLPRTPTSVRVTHPDGASAQLPGLILNPDPVVTGVGPVANLSAGGSAVTVVSGNYFHSAATVSFGSSISVSDVVWLDSSHIQLRVTVLSTAAPGAYNVTVTNPNRGSGVLAAGFRVNYPIALSSVTPDQVGLRAGTETYFAIVAGHAATIYNGVSLSLAGRGFSPDITLRDLSFSNPGIERLTSNMEVFDPSQSYSLQEIGMVNYRSIPEGDTTITSGTFNIQIPEDAPIGAGTLTLTNTDGSTATWPFSVNRGPELSAVTPSALVRGKVQQVSVSGFGFDLTNPKVCFGVDCAQGKQSGVQIVSSTPQSANQIALEVWTQSDADLGSIPVTVKNPDQGFVTRTGMVTVVSGFSINPDLVEISVGGGPLPVVLTGTGFVNAPAAPQVEFLLPNGQVDGNLDVTASYSSSTRIDLSVTATATAAAGPRGIRVTNGDGAIEALDQYLLVTNASGPTIGHLWMPDGAGGLDSAERLGLDQTGPRTVSDMVLTGSGLSGSGLTLAFDLAGITVSNIAVVSDKEVHFDLTLAANMTPGVAALTVTTVDGSDTRAGLLTVTAPPVLTALLPATLAPASQKVSVLAFGGGFRPGVKASVSPDDGSIVFNDMDSDLGGLQTTDTVSAGTVRMVVDVSTSALGDYTLSLTNPDGGYSEILLPVVLPQVGTPAKVAYMEGLGSVQLKVRDWVGKPAIGPPLVSDSPELPLTSTNAELWSEIRANPMNPGEYLLMVGDGPTRDGSGSSLKLLRTLPDGVSWENIATLSSGPLLPPVRWFDAAYEQAGSGRGLLVYSSGDALLFKRITPDGVDFIANDTVQVGGNPPFTQGRPLWIRMIPRPGTRQIMVLYMTDQGYIQALLWDGGAALGQGAFVSQYDAGGGTPLSTNAVAPYSAASEVYHPGFDAAWEGTGNGAVVFWGEEGSNDLRAVTWNGVDWGPLSVMTSPVSGSGITYLQAKADPGSTQIAVLVSAANGGKRAIVSHSWDGGWSAEQSVLTDSTLSVFYADRHFDIGWDDAGTLVALYSRSIFNGSDFIVTHLENRKWTAAQGWSAPAILPLHKSAGNTAPVAVRILDDPESGGLLALTLENAGVLNNSARIYLYRWSGNDWSDATELAHTVERFGISSQPGSTKHYRLPSSLAYRGDLVPPDAVVLTEVSRTSTGGVISWTAPGDNRMVGQAGGYDIRWSDLMIVDDDPLVDCATLLVDGKICFSEANQVLPAPSPLPGMTNDATVIEPVTWTDLVGVAVNGTVLSKTAAAGWGNGGAASQQTIPADGAVEFTALETNTGRFMGLSSVNADANFASIDYAIVLNLFQEVRVYERGVNLGTFGSYVPGDVFRIQRVGNQIVYFQNGTPIYTSTVPSSGSLLVDVALNQTGATVADGTVFNVLPGRQASTEQLALDMGASGVYYVALKSGDRKNAVDPVSGAETLRHNVSPISNVLQLTTLPSDPIPPEAVTDLAAAPGTTPDTRVNLTWTGVGDDGALLSTNPDMYINNDPVQAYEIRMASIPIAEVGSVDNYRIPYDQATLLGVVAPATDGGGGTRGVANSYMVTGLTPGTTYFFAVKGLDEDITQYAPVSNEASITTAPDTSNVVPDPVTDLVVSDVTANTMSLVWTAAGGSPDKYEMRWSTSPILTQADFDAAVKAFNQPLPAPAGTRQTYTVTGLLPDMVYHVALVPVRFLTVSGVYTRLAPEFATASGMTLSDTSGSSARPSTVSDLELIAGTTRTNDLALSWTAPNAPGGQTVRYELLRAMRPIASAAPDDIKVTVLPMIPSPAGVVEEFTVTGLPENTVFYMVLRSYSKAGLVSAVSNEVTVHTALRAGINAISVPGALTDRTLSTLFGGVVGYCANGGMPVTLGTGGSCPGGGTPTVLAYRWNTDPLTGPVGEFVTMGQTETVPAGEGVFLFAPGNQAVVDVAGYDLPSFPAVTLSQDVPTLISNPFSLPRTVSGLTVTGSDGSVRTFSQAVLDGIIDPVLKDYARVNGVLRFVDVTETGMLLPYHAYFLRPGVTPAAGVTYQVEVPAQ